MKNKNNNKKVMHIVAFVLGIISIISGLFWYIALPTGIMAIVFGAKSYRAYGNKIGLSGLIMGIVGTSITAFIYISLAMIIILQNYA